MISCKMAGLKAFNPHVDQARVSVFKSLVLHWLLPIGMDDIDLKIRFDIRDVISNEHDSMSVTLTKINSVQFYTANTLCCLRVH
jgi:hypothetical protein